MTRGLTMRAKVGNLTKKTGHKKKSVEKRRDPFDLLRKRIANGFDYFNQTDSWMPEYTDSLSESSVERHVYDIQQRILSKPLDKISEKRIDHAPVPVPVANNAQTGNFRTGFPSDSPIKKAMNISNAPPEYDFVNFSIVASTPVTSKVKNRRKIARALYMVSHSYIGVSTNMRPNENHSSPKHAVAAMTKNLPPKPRTQRSVFHMGSLRNSIAEDPDIILIDDSTITNTTTDANNNNDNGDKSEISTTQITITKTIENSAACESPRQESAQVNAPETLTIPLETISHQRKSPIVMKSGKWRRNVRDIRQSSQSSSQRQTFHMSMNHRKSIFVREFPTSNGQASCMRSFLNISPSIHSEATNTVGEASANITSINFNQKSHLLRKCGQSCVLPFDEVFSKTVLEKGRKIGEGVFGEIYLNCVDKSKYVLKVIPIEGTKAINGTQQKRFDEILQEVIISQELSALHHDDDNHQTTGFVKVLNVHLVEGRYPTPLLDLWDTYKKCNGSENESPECFDDNQLYVVFELTHSGVDLEKYIFKNANQSYSVFKQVAFSLAVAESKFEFEHRDLHWGNILIAPTKQKTIKFSLNGKVIAIPSYGVKATIIDYTLSRILYKNCCFYQDLSADPELFEAIGDYQYDIYRLMRLQTNDQWGRYVPYTNLLWMHYVIHKINDGVRYSGKKTNKSDRIVIDEMNKVKTELLTYESVTDYVEQKLSN